MLLCQLDELLVRNTTSTNEHHTVRGVIRLDVRLEVRALNRLDVLLRPKNGTAERLVLESSGMQVVENNFLELLVYLLLFPKNDVALALNGGWLELGVLQDVGEDVDGIRNVGVERLGVVDGVLSLLHCQYVRRHMCCSADVAPTEVYALRWPPMFSISSSSCDWLLFCVPLKAKCSRKCAVPFVRSVSARDPASIHTPTVDVWA